MYITSIDIGTKSIKAVTAEVKKNNTISIVNVVKALSEGVRRGEIIHPDETVPIFFRVLKEINRLDKKCLKNLLFSISGPSSLFIISQSATSIPHSDQVILPDDVDNVINEAVNITKKTGWKLLHSSPQEFIIDGISVNSQSIHGLSGRKLETSVAVVSIFESAYNNLEKLIKLVLGKKKSFDGSLFFAPFASDRAVLSTKQKDLGVVMLDVGAGTIGVVVYQDGKMVYSKVFPFGSDNITNDIVAGLKCNIKVAEKIKEEFGVALSKGVSSKDKINLSTFDENDDRNIQKKYIAEIIEARVREMFKVISDELSLIGIEENLPAGVVITGGGSKMPGMMDVVREELKLPVQIGIPDTSVFDAMDSKISSKIEDPEMSVSVGMILNKLDIMNDYGIPRISGGDLKSDSGVKKKLKSLFKLISIIE